MLNQEQLVKDAVRAAQRRGVRIALTGYLIFFGGIMGERYISSSESNAARETIVRSGTAVAVTACNERFKDRRQLREVLIIARRETRKSEDISPDRRKAAEAFYTERLAALPLPDCRDSLTVLSDDPDAEVHIPKPLYLPDKPE